MIMYDAPQIFNYLPLRREINEERYIDHLWQAFISLDGSDEDARPFEIMPFHLLFMMAVQYKVLSIANSEKRASDLFFSGVGGRDKDKILKSQRSVFDIALINERTIFEIFQLVDLDCKIISEIKKIINDRNDNLAHAKGGIEVNIDEKINKYIIALAKIQKRFLKNNVLFANKIIANIKLDTDMEQYLEQILFDTRINYFDFGIVVDRLLKNSKLKGAQWVQTAQKGLSLCHDRILTTLVLLTLKSPAGDVRYNAAKILNDKNELDDKLKEYVINNVNDRGIKELFMG